jgi:hypothetical protein
MFVARVCGVFALALLLSAGLAGAQTADDIDVKRPCTFMFSVPSGTTQLRGMCPNHYGGPWEIKAVACDATAGGITVLPKLSKGANDSVLAKELTCGTNEPAGSEAKGTPRLNVRTVNGATCSKVPCDLELTIKAPEDGKTHSGLISVIGTLTVGPKP